MTFSPPSLVSAVSTPLARSVTHRLLSRTKATRRPSGENLANIWYPGFALTGVSRLTAKSQT